MPSRTLLVVLLVSVVACGPMRSGEPVSVDVAEQSADADVPSVERSPLACLDHPLIDVWEQRLRTERRFRVTTVESIVRGSPYLERFREILREAGLPGGLALLPVIESSFRTNAIGSYGSVGLWQLQAPTARRFGLVVNRRRDDRLDPERATQAAVAYLSLLHDRYEDWPLALAAYNAGEGRVDRALDRLPGASFWELAEMRHLPPISRDYVPRFLATVRVAETGPSC